MLFLHLCINNYGYRPVVYQLHLHVRSENAGGHRDSELPEATRKAIDADGWLHTGDEASMDPDGCFRITGRIKDLIIRGGENIAPKEIEDRLREHPSVADAYVYGVPDDFFGEAVAAAVRPKADVRPTAEELIGWCADTMAKFKIPRYVRLVDGFPMTASGKIQKYKLRQEHEQLLKTSPEEVFEKSGKPASTPRQ